MAEAIKKSRAVAKRKFNRKATLFKEAIDRSDPPDLLKTLHEEVCVSYQNVEEFNEKYLVQLETDDFETEEKLAEEYIVELEQLKNELFVKLIEHLKSLDIEEPIRHRVNVKALEPPKFGGNLREYPTFKKNYLRLMESSYGQDPFALQQCLYGDALEAVKGVEDEYLKMFKRLDDKFGNPSKITDSILNDLRSLKPLQDGDYKSFIEFVNIVENCWLDLTKMNLSSEMTTTTVVSQIERLLPMTQKREWVLISQDIESSSLFEELLNFLLKEKKALEYMESDIRMAKRSKAIVHNLVGEESENLLSLTELIKNQFDQQKQVVECLNQVNQLLQNLTGRTNNFNVNRKPMSSNISLLSKGCWYHNLESHSILECSVFKKLDNPSKFEAIKRRGVCFICLQNGHISKDCNDKTVCNVINAQKEICGQNHHPLLHDMFMSMNTFDRRTNNNLLKREGVLLMINNVKCYNQNISTLWDPGSNMTLITHRMAKKLGLKGFDVSLSITKVGNHTVNFGSKEYMIPITDMNGNLWKLKAYGINEITTELNQVDAKEISQIFDINANEIIRPTGKIELLVGSDYCNLLPKVIKTIGNLQLMKNQFGFCVRGSHPLVKVFDSNTNICIRIHHMAGMICTNDIQVEPKLSLTKQLDEFFEVENLGVQCVPKCGSCKCGKCPVGSKFTIKEERELDLIEKGLNHNEITNQWLSYYPWIRNPNDLPNNVSLAISRLKSTERRLNKLGESYSKMYCDQMQDMLDRKVAREIEHEELNEYKGPIHYIPHHEILKPESNSTPLRIVFNSSSSFMGHSLNEYWGKGPDVLNNQLGILLRFRQNDIAIAGDIAKMYNAIQISELDQHTHRFVWRDMNMNANPKHYALTAVTFGDKPSGVIAMLALRKTAEKSVKIYPNAANMIIKNSYVDDIIHSVQSRVEAKEMIKQTDKILDFGGFRIKHWVISGMEEDNDSRILNTNEEKILGLKWKTKEDKFTFKVRLNFSDKYKKVHTGPNLSKFDIEDMIPKSLSKRMILSQTASIYDPLGLVLPFTLRAKLLMRELVSEIKIVKDGLEHSLDWDDPVPDDMHNKWKTFFKDMFDLELLKFNRCVRPLEAVGEPSLIVYSDGSTQAYGACAYVRWKLSNGQFVSKLLIAKNKIAPNRQLTVPRLELCGALLGARLRETIIREIDWKFDSIMHIVDSAIVRAQIQKDSYGFSTFVATRIAEIQSKTEGKEWFWVAAGDNPADLVTRVTHPCKLSEKSVWQNGPEYLSQSIEKWPISQTNIEDLPDRIHKSTQCTTICSPSDFRLDFLDLRRFSNYNKMLRVTSRVINALKEKSFKGLFKEVTGIQMKESEFLWIRHVQQNFGDDWKVRFQRLGPMKDENGIIIVGQRIAKWQKNNWNQHAFILIPAKHKFTRMYVEHIHNIDHAGIDVTLAKVQSKFWIPGIRKIIKSIKNKCVTCRKINKKVEGQNMGQLPEIRLNPSPPFYHTALDLFGPFEIKDTIKKRTKCKVYGVVFNCLASRAIHVDVVEGYDCENFLVTLRRFVALRGFPNTIHSDAGTQLVAANKELRQMVKKWEISKIKEFGSNEGLNWTFTKSANAPWENGCSESMIKIIKRLIILSVGNNVLTFSELQTVFFEIANLINERPIGYKPGCDPDLGSYLSPNDLILGRTSNKVPSGVWDFTENHRKRLNFIKEIVSCFWKKWTRDYFPTLIVRQKWHTEKRNLQAGDIVLVQDSNNVKGVWKLAQVVIANPGSDGKVRDVTVRYKSQNIGSSYKGQEDILVNRSAHRLVVLLPVEEI